MLNVTLLPAGALAAGLRALADQLEDEEDVLLPAAVDTFAADFLRARICPHPAQLPDQGMLGWGYGGRPSVHQPSVGMAF